MRRVCMIIALACLAVPAVATAAASPGKLAKRISAAPDLRAAVSATREALAAGGVATVANGKVVKRAKSRAAPVAASGTEVLNLAVEAQQKETAGRITLAGLAAKLRAARFPFHRPRRAAGELRTLLKVWVRGARRNRGDQRTFTPLFLAAMAKRQSRPVDLAKGNYKPPRLRLTQLEVELFVAAFQRGPRRRWNGSRAGRRSAAVSQGEFSPCTDYRKFQREQLKELYGEKVAGDLDKILDYGFQMLGGDATEKSLAAGIEQGFLGLRGRKRPGQRAKGLSGQAAKRAMIALNVLLKVQKLATLYGSVGIKVKPQFDTKHKPDGSKLPVWFLAVAGIDPEAQKEYEAEKKKLDQESNMQKALRDCLKMVGIPSLTTVGDLAEEMEKWRVKWHFDFLNNHAEYDFKHSKYDPPGSFKHYLRRVSTSEAGALAYMYVKPETARDHAGCQPGTRQTPVTATVDLDTSQPPGLGTAIDVATGNVLGVALDAAQAMFQALVTPSGSATMIVEYHIPDKATASAAQVCIAFPKSWSATIGGTGTHSGGIVESFTANYTLAQTSKGDGFASYDSRATNAIQWSISGTDSQGCSYSGSAILDLGGDLGLYYTEGLKSYALKFFNASPERVDVSVQCPNGSHVTQFSPLSWTSTESDSHPWTGSNKLKDSRAYAFDNGNVDINWNWDLSGHF